MHRCPSRGCKEPLVLRPGRLDPDRAPAPEVQVRRTLRAHLSPPVPVPRFLGTGPAQVRPGHLTQPSSQGPASLPAPRGSASPTGTRCAQAMALRVCSSSFPRSCSGLPRGPRFLGNGGLVQPMKLSQEALHVLSLKVTLGLVMETV